MAVIPVTGYITYHSSVNNTAHPFVLPTGIPDGSYKAYIMVSWGGGSATTIVNIPGWTLVDGPYNVNNSITNAIYSRNVGSAQSGVSTTISMSGGCALSVAGIVAEGTLDVLSSHTSDSGLVGSSTLAGFTPGDADCLAVHLFSGHHPASTVVGIASGPSGFTQRVDVVTTPTTQAMPESVLYTKQLTGQNGVAQGSTTVSWNDSVRTNKWVLTIAPVPATVGASELDRYGRLAGASYFRYHTGVPGTIVPPVTTLGTMLIGASHLTYVDLDNKLNNPTGSKPGGTNTGMSVKRNYDNSWPKLWPGTVSAPDVAAGVASIWSMSDTSWIDVFATGSQNANLRAFFNSIPANHTVWCVFWHEVNVHYRTFATYRAAFANIKASADASSRDPQRVKVGGLLTHGGFRAGDADQYFDGSHEFVGLDLYHYHNSDPLSPGYAAYPTPRTTAYLASKAVDKAKQLGVPMICGELGSHANPANHAERPNLIDEDLTYLEDNGCSAVCWFHSPVGKADRIPWWLDAFPNWSDMSDHTTYPDPDSLAKYRDWLESHVRYTSGMIVP